MTVLPDSVDPQNPNANLLSNLLEREKKDWEEIYRILEVVFSLQFTYQFFRTINLPLKKKHKADYSKVQKEMILI